MSDPFSPDPPEVVVKKRRRKKSKKLFSPETPPENATHEPELTAKDVIRGSRLFRR